MNTALPLGLSTRSFFAFVIVAIIIGVPGVARADLPRPEGWKPSCTIEKEAKKGGVSCEQCRGWRDPDPCQKALEDKGFVLHCTEGGAGSFVAVWCKGPEEAPIATDTPAAPTTPTTTTTPATPTTTTTPATPTTPTTPATPPPVAPATDNRRGSGMCSVSSIGQDKHDHFFWSLVSIGIGLGLWRRHRSSRPGLAN